MIIFKRTLVVYLKGYTRALCLPLLATKILHCVWTCSLKLFIPVSSSVAAATLTLSCYVASSANIYFFSYL